MKELIDRESDESAVEKTLTNEGNKGGGADGLESDSEGRIYATSYEHNAIVRRRVDGQYETLPQMGIYTLHPTSCIGKQSIRVDKTNARSHTHSSEYVLMRNLFSCAKARNKKS